jgi:hypothetical protein
VYRDGKFGSFPPCFAFQLDIPIRLGVYPSAAAPNAATLGFWRSSVVSAAVDRCVKVELASERRSFLAWSALDLDAPRYSTYEYRGLQRVSIRPGNAS